MELYRCKKRFVPINQNGHNGTLAKVGRKGLGPMNGPELRAFSKNINTATFFSDNPDINKKDKAASYFSVSPVFHNENLLLGSC